MTYVQEIPSQIQCVLPFNSYGEQILQDVKNDTTFVCAFVTLT